MPHKGMFKKFISLISAGALALAFTPAVPPSASAQSERSSASSAVIPAEESGEVEYGSCIQKNFTYHTMESNASATTVATASSAQKRTLASEGPVAIMTTDDPDATPEKQYYLDAWNMPVAESDDADEQTEPADSLATSSGADIRRAWTLSKNAEKAGGDAAVTIAELDTGVDVEHEDLADNIDTEHMGTVERQKDGSYAVEPGHCEDIYGHGTHVAGILAAAANNGKGIAGVSYNARLLPVSVCYEDDDGACTTDTRHLLAGFSYLEQLIEEGELTNLRVINISLGNEADSSGNEDYALESAIKTFRDKYNVLTVCAGGNGDEDGEPITDRVFPSDFSETFSVSWLDSDGTVNASADYNECKDISAPGTDIYSTMDASKSLYNKAHKSYGTMSGSSMAAPVVSGIAALLWAKYPELTTDEVRASLQQTAHEIPDAPKKLGSAGAVDAAAAIEYAGKNFSDQSRIRISGAQVASEDFSDDTDWYLPYTGDEQRPSFTLSVLGEELQEGVDYVTHYIDNVDSGTATVVFTGIGEYRGTKVVHFDIVNDLGTCSVSPIAAQEYTGAAVLPDLEVLDRNGDELQEGVDYVISGASDNVEIGQASLQIRGVHQYRGELDAKFWIVAKGTGSSKSATVNTKKVTEKALAGALKSNTTTVTLGSKVQGVSARAFQNFPKVTKLVVKTKKLTKSSVKDALKGSKVKTIQVSLGSKKLNQRYAKKYKAYLS